MKIQRIGCKTCGAIFAVCRDDSAGSKWYKDVSNYLANGNSFVETIEHPEGSPFGDIRTSKCCGKKAAKPKHTV